MVPATAASDNFFTAKSGGLKIGLATNRNVIRSTLSFLTRKERTRFTFLIILDIAVNIVDILSLALLVWIIQFYIQPEAKAVSFLPAWIVNKNSIAFITVFFLLFSIKNLIAFLIARAQNNFNATVAVRISKDYLHAYQNAEFDEFVNLDSSNHIRKIGFQPFDFCQHLLFGLQQIITQTVLIVLTVIAIVFFNARLFLLLLLILLPPVVAVFYFIKKGLTKDRLYIKKSNQSSFQYLMDALKGFVESNIYNRNDFFLRRFVSSRKQFSQHLFHSISIQTLPSRLIEIFAVLGLFILIVIANWSGGNDATALITVGAFMAAAYKIIPGLVKIINAASQIKAYEFSLTDVVPVENKISDQSLSEEIHSVKFSGVRFYFDRSLVLDNLSLSIQSGDFLGITGRSGKGKTTLFNLLLGFLSPYSGEISINDATCRKNEIRNYWPSISYVRQQTFFIHDTILRNITLEEESYDEQRLQSAIKISGLSDLINDSAEGLYKVITENGKNISGGQQQRIMLARALYKDAALILLDEPFNELDEASELLLLHHFKELAGKGKMVVMITHNKKALSFCNKVLSLDEE